jgi:hypothetical protein
MTERPSAALCEPAAASGGTGRLGGAACVPDPLRLDEKNPARRQGRDIPENPGQPWQA